MICDKCRNYFYSSSKINERCLICNITKCNIVNERAHFDAITASQKLKDLMHLKLVGLIEKMEKWIDRQEYNDRMFREEMEKLNEHNTENENENLFNQNNE